MAVSQGFIQPIAQDAQRTIPNNGNPNTVYNRAPTEAPVTGWAANPISPAANYNGTDAAQTISDGEAAIAKNGWTAPAPDPNVKQGQGMLQLPEGWADKIQNFTPSAPVAPAAPAAPTYDLNKQWYVMDGKVPRKNLDLYNSDPVYKDMWDFMAADYRAATGRNIEERQSEASAIERSMKIFYEMYHKGWRPDPQFVASGGKQGNRSGYYVDSAGNPIQPAQATSQTNQAGGGDSTGAGSGGNSGGTNFGLGNRVISGDQASSAINYANSTTQPSNSGWNKAGGDIASNLASFVDSTFSTIGSNATAGNVMKALDALTEPFLPGNMYMSELGQVNMPNVLTAVLNKALPGIGTLAKYIATKIPQDATGLLGSIRDFFQKGQFQQAANAIYKQYDMEKAQNQATYGGGSGAGGGTEGGGWSGSGWVSVGGSAGGGGGGRTGTVTLGDLKNPDTQSSSK